MNRRQRRAQASSSPKTLQSADNIPMAQPDRTKDATVKTLYELAAERQAELMPSAGSFDATPFPANVVNVKIGANGEIVREEKDNQEGADGDVLRDDELVPPILDTLFLAISLSVLHFTLEVLTVHQYAQELLFTPVVKHAIFVAFPTLFLVIHLFRGHLLPISVSGLPLFAQRAVAVFRQLLLVSIANVAGCYLIQLTNDKGYYAVMKNAPSVGVLWVWAVLELGLAGALAGVVGPGVYAWYWGYSVV